MLFIHCVVSVLIASIWTFMIHRAESKTTNERKFLMFCFLIIVVGWPLLLALKLLELVTVWANRIVHWLFGLKPPF